MSELGGLDIGMPDEGQGGAPEQLSEEAAARFAAAKAAAQQLQKEERKAKKRDDSVAQAIMQFLTDEQRSHFAVIISRLIARDCPSVFVLAILSLINDSCREEAEKYLAERDASTENIAPNSTDLSQTSKNLSEESHLGMTHWLMRMELVLATDPQNILDALLVDEGNVDGTVLQLTSFVLQEFIRTQQKEMSFEDIQKLAIRILQSIFAPYLQEHLERKELEAAETQKNEDED